MKHTLFPVLVIIPTGWIPRFHISFPTNRQHGEVFLPVEKLDVKVGEQILVVGENGLRVSSEKGMIKRVGQETIPWEKSRAGFPGRLQNNDVLSLSKDNGSIRF